MLAEGAGWARRRRTSLFLGAQPAPGKATQAAALEMVECSGGETKRPRGGHARLILPSPNVGSATVPTVCHVTLRNVLLPSNLLWCKPRLTAPGGRGSAVLGLQFL